MNFEQWATKLHFSIEPELRSGGGSTVLTGEMDEVCELFTGARSEPEMKRNKMN